MAASAAAARARASAAAAAGAAAVPRLQRALSRGSSSRSRSISCSSSSSSGWSSSSSGSGRARRRAAACRVAADAGSLAAEEAQAPAPEQGGGGGGQVFDFDEEPQPPAAASNSDAARGSPDVVVQAARSSDELAAVARLRAEAYHADDHSRFAASFKRQFAAQEVESLRQRTAGGAGRPQLCDCLVAVDPGSGAVQGCIDIRLPQSATGTRTIGAAPLPPASGASAGGPARRPRRARRAAPPPACAAGVPEGEPAGCYLLNVVVDEAARGRGIGRALMRAAMARAVRRWGAARMYTHVEADNEVAVALYKGCGFEEHSSEAAYANTSALGRLVLLVAEAAAAPELGDTLWHGEGEE
ncbi:mshD [Scenedesmus sp. PABB004]|nr:mshD [Scenedesmus sp. PABB004]